MKVLLVDDSADVGNLVKQSLNPLTTVQSLTLSDARKMMATTHFDLMLIDVNLPDGDGFSFCNEVFKNPLYTTTPLILLTSKNEVADKVFGLNCGACDYITKPFQSMELNARVQAHLRHRSLLTEASLKTNYFELDLNLQKCFILKDKTRVDISLTPTEFRLLHCLYKNRDNVMSREELIRSVWSTQGASIEPKGLDTHIVHLRKKLGDLESLIVSVYGKGYVFKDLPL